MKNYILILVVLLLVNCSSNENSENEDVSLLGKWKLIEQLADPGDGSGVFNPITSNRTFEFFKNGDVTANGTLCFMSSEVGEIGSGTFMEIAGGDFSDGEITPNNCSINEAVLYYKLKEGNLIIWYLCIEACGQKFVKIQ
jgi:hypothetical protein